MKQSFYNQGNPFYSIQFLHGYKDGKDLTRFYAQEDDVLLDTKGNRRNASKLQAMKHMIVSLSSLSLNTRNETYDSPEGCQLHQKETLLLSFTCIRLSCPRPRLHTLCNPHTYFFEVPLRSSKSCNNAKIVLQLVE